MGVEWRLYISYSILMPDTTPHRSHRDVIAVAGGPSRLARMLKCPAGRAHQWKRADSIPPRYWAAIVLRGHASLEELAGAAARRTRASPA
jgi:hypothetical protein